MTRFEGVDIVVAGSRVGETQSFGTLEVSETDGKLLRPHLKTLSVNLTGAIYTTQLALHYLPKTRNQTEPLKYVVFLGFLASWTAHPDQEIFVTSQHGLLGFARLAQPALTLHGIRIVTVQSCPPGHGDTNSTFRKTANVMFFCATNPDSNANGSVWGMGQHREWKKRRKEGVLGDRLHILIYKRLEIWEGMRNVGGTSP
ncbi:hypothetical protein BDM02DRAFT_3133525 [Thelephora ganbajun]|uniref:Uncharacterized protein n=1 Tax=Thelephora ganbajun TaxID=370292 RepID=A0ACB6YXI5_THEGA|nr:hypothetical protein BDM02DRAFT_3133525 [Thelephora ganbajun]